jgi:hypothetical protein
MSQKSKKKWKFLGLSVTPVTNRPVDICDDSVAALRVAQDRDTEAFVKFN